MQTLDRFPVLGGNSDINVYPVIHPQWSGTGGGLCEQEVRQRLDSKLNIHCIFKADLILAATLPDTLEAVLPGPSEQLRLIRDTLSLSMSDLAAVMGVSRPTIYAWLEGDEPNLDNQKALTRLWKVAKELGERQIERCDKLIKRPIFEGQTLLDKLKANQEVSDCLDVIQAISEREAQERRTPKGSGKTVDNSGLRRLSTPVDKSGFTDK
jgi:transcriptional regulator with XRE-family HTH domain